MSHYKNSDVVPVTLEVNQITEGQKYKGFLSIGLFKIYYVFQSIIPICEIKDNSLQKLSEIESRKILFPTRLYTSHQLNKKDIYNTPWEEDFIFFHNILYPNIKRFYFNPEMIHFNKNDEKKSLFCMSDKKGSIKKPLRMVTVPREFYIFGILVCDIPRTILVLTK